MASNLLLDPRQGFMWITTKSKEINNPKVLAAAVFDVRTMMPSHENAERRSGCSWTFGGKGLGVGIRWVFQQQPGRLTRKGLKMIEGKVVLEFANSFPKLGNGFGPHWPRAVLQLPWGTYMRDDQGSFVHLIPFSEGCQLTVIHKQVHRSSYIVVKHSECSVAIVATWAQDEPGAYRYLGSALFQHVKPCVANCPRGWSSEIYATPSQTVAEFPFG